MSDETKVKLDNFGEVSIDQLVELVRVAETAERYEDMCKFMKQLVLVRTEAKKRFRCRRKKFIKCCI